MSTDDERRALGRKLRELREGLKMTYASVELATDGGAPMAYVNALEDGGIRLPAPHVLFALAGAYSYPYEKLMELAGHIRPNPLRGELRALCIK